jgi:hypothetical protein
MTAVESTAGGTAEPPTPQGGAHFVLGVLGGGVAAIGAVLVIVSRFLHFGAGVSAWDGLTKRYSVINMILALVVVALLVPGLIGHRPPVLRAATCVGAYVFGSMFPLILPSFGHLQIGFWMGAIGGALLLVGADIAVHEAADTRAPGAPNPALSAVAAVALIVLIGSLALHIESHASAWSAPDLGTHYALGLTLLSVAGIGLIALALTGSNWTVLSYAAFVAFFLFAQAFPLLFNSYNPLKIGFWVGAVGSLVAAALLLVAIIVRPGASVTAQSG